MLQGQPTANSIVSYQFLRDSKQCSSSLFSPFVWSPNYYMYLQRASSKEYRAIQKAGYGGFAAVYCISGPTTRRHTSTLSCGRFPHIKLEKVSITGYGSCLPRSGRRSCIQGVLTAQKLRTKFNTTRSEGSDTNSPHSTFESPQNLGRQVLFDGRQSSLRLQLKCDGTR
jgi:hypothetical protein